MGLEKIIEKANLELRNRTWGYCQQFFEIHEIVLEGEKPKISRIGYQKDKSEIIIYYSVKEENFFFCIILNTEGEIVGIYSESLNRVYLRAESKTMNKIELENLSNLKVTGGHNVGDQKGNKKRNASWCDSVIFIEPNPEPDSFENKLEKLLHYLESDINGVKELVNKASGYIQVIMEIHNGNGMLGGPHLNINSLKRLSELGLELNFDLYVSGNYFKR